VVRSRFAGLTTVFLYRSGTRRFVKLWERAAIKQTAHLAAGLSIGRASRAGPSRPSGRKAQRVLGSGGKKGPLGLEV